MLTSSILNICQTNTNTRPFTSFYLFSCYKKLQSLSTIQGPFVLSCQVLIGWDRLFFMTGKRRAFMSFDHFCKFCPNPMHAKHRTLRQFILFCHVLSGLDRIRLSIFYDREEEGIYVFWSFLQNLSRSNACKLQNTVQGQFVLSCLVMSGWDVGLFFMIGKRRVFVFLHRWEIERERERAGKFPRFLGVTKSWKDLSC